MWLSGGTNRLLACDFNEHSSRRIGVPNTAANLIASVVTQTLVMGLTGEGPRVVFAVNPFELRKVPLVQGCGAYQVASSLVRGSQVVAADQGVRVIVAEAVLVLGQRALEHLDGLRQVAAGLADAAEQAPGREGVRVIGSQHLLAVGW